MSLGWRIAFGCATRPCACSPIPLLTERPRRVWTVCLWLMALSLTSRGQGSGAAGLAITLSHTPPSGCLARCRAGLGTGSSHLSLPAIQGLCAGSPRRSPSGLQTGRLGRADTPIAGRPSSLGRATGCRRGRRGAAASDDGSRRRWPGGQWRRRRRGRPAPTAQQQPAPGRRRSRSCRPSWRRRPAERHAGGGLVGELWGAVYRLVSPLG